MLSACPCHHSIVKSASEKKMTNNRVHVIQVAEVSDTSNEERQEEQQVSQSSEGRNYIQNYQ